jgi:hypothetical protein
VEFQGFFLKVLLGAQGSLIEYIVRDCNFPYFVSVMMSETFLQTEYIDKCIYLNLLGLSVVVLRILTLG